MRLPGGVDEAERLRNRTKSRTRARVAHPFLVLKRLWGFAKARYRGLAKNANRAFTAKAMVNLYLAARRTPALVRPSLARTRFKAPEPPSRRPTMAQLALLLGSTSSALVIAGT